MNPFDSIDFEGLFKKYEKETSPEKKAIPPYDPHADESPYLKGYPFPKEVFQDDETFMEHAASVYEGLGLTYIADLLIAAFKAFRERKHPIVISAYYALLVVEFASNSDSALQGNDHIAIESLGLQDDPDAWN